jgi:hypothetical protein
MPAGVFLLGLGGWGGRAAENAGTGGLLREVIIVFFACYFGCFWERVQPIFVCIDDMGADMLSSYVSAIDE